MELFNEFVTNPETQMLIPLLLILVPMLRKIPRLPKWTIQWIVLVIAILLSLSLSGFNFTAISNGFFASMAVTYVTVGVTRRKEEKITTEQKSYINGLHQRLLPIESDEQKIEQLAKSQLSERVPQNRLVFGDRVLVKPTKLPKEQAHITYQSEEQLYQALSKQANLQLINSCELCPTCVKTLQTAISQQDLEQPVEKP